MSNVSIEFRKPIFRGNKFITEASSAFKIKDSKFKRLPLGGYEGKKFFTPLVNPRYNKGRKDVISELGFLSKELSKEQRKKDVIEIIRAYASLRDKGYPVPATTRYFEKDGKTYLLMTDMTEKGKYKIWGFSNYMTDQQNEDLKSMNLTEKDMKIIEEKAFNFATKANKDRIGLLFHTYHVRKNQRTGEIDIVFLDLNPYVIQHNNFIHLNDNHTDAIIFIKKLKDGVENQKVSC